MRINEIIAEANIEEGPLLNKFGTAVGKAVGGAGKAVGAVAGGVAGLGKAIKKGYQAGKSTVSGAGDDTGGTGAAVGSGVAGGLAAAGGGASAAAPAADPGAETAAKTLQQQIDKLSPETKAELLKQLQASADKPAAAAAPAAPETPAAKPNATSTDLGPVGDVKPGAEPAQEPSATAAAPAATGGTAAPAAQTAAPAGKTAAPANKAASDTFEKAKGDIRKVQSGTKPLPDQMAQGVQADIAKMAKGDKESGVAAAQKIMGFAQKGMDVAALQQAWSANAKAGERFLSQSVYRSITNMLREHGLIWSDLNLRVRIDESVGSGVFIRYAKPVVESVQLFRIK